MHSALCLLQVTTKLRLPPVRLQPGVPPVYEGSWVQMLNSAGYSVIGLDNQGAGRSAGLRAFCRSFDEYMADVLMLAKLAPQLGIPGVAASLPRFAMGASKGGMLAVMSALRDPGLFQGVALLAPMLSLDKVCACEITLCMCVYVLLWYCALDYIP